MSIENKFFYTNIRDYLAFGMDDDTGEPELLRMLSWRYGSIFRSGKRGQAVVILS